MKIKNRLYEYTFYLGIELKEVFLSPFLLICFNSFSLYSFTFKLNILIDFEKDFEGYLNFGNNIAGISVNVTRAQDEINLKVNKKLKFK